MRWPAFWLSFLVLAAPAGAAVRVAGEPMHSLTEWRGAALAVVASGDLAEPFELVRSSGRGRSLAGTFGLPGAEFPEVAARGDRAFVSWAVPVSGGAELSTATLNGERLPAVQATGPGRLAVGEEAAQLAYPDRDGNARLATLTAAPAFLTLTRTGPHRRHLPMAAAAARGGTLVLDLIQERNRTELRVVGPGAPAAPVLSVRALRHLPARMAVSGDRIAVGWLDRGRARLAVARLGGTWARRTLPGRGRGDGAPAPTFVAGSLGVVYTQRGEVYAWRAGRLRRLTRTPGAERDAMAAGAFAGWTRRDSRERSSAWITRLP